MRVPYVRDTTEPNRATAYGGKIVSPIVSAEGGENGRAATENLH